MAKTGDSAGRGRGSARGGDAAGSKPAAKVNVPTATAIESYPDAIKYLNNRTNYERVKPGPGGADAYRLDRMREILRALGDPQRDVKCVHVAGSKGKGSTVEMTSAALTGCGLATGAYTSPHLVHLRERIRIGNECISNAHFTALMNRIAAAASGVETRHGQLTFFEVLTTLALLHFAEQAVDIAVIETGLGGRLDCTNVVTPEVTAITAIQLEHTQILGNTLPEIAREKAGIFKPGVPAITAPQHESVLAVFREVAARVRAPLAVLGEEIEFAQRVDSDKAHGPRARVCVSTERFAFEHIPSPLPGEHQGVNCALALAILGRLRDRGFEIPEREAVGGLAGTPRNGRMEMICANPRILIDGAHTPDSLHALVRTIGATLRYDSMVVVFGCAEDKDVEGMLTKVSLGADKIIFTRADGNPRALAARELLRRFGDISPKMAQAAESLPEALRLASRAAGRDDLICVTGSFYLAGEAKKHIADLAARKSPPTRAP